MEANTWYNDATTRHRTLTDWGSDDMRKAFYRAADGIGAARSAYAKRPPDAELAKRLRDLQSAIDAVHAHLRENYLWD